MLWQLVTVLCLALVPCQPILAQKNKTTEATVQGTDVNSPKKLLKVYYTCMDEFEKQLCYCNHLTQASPSSPSMETKCPLGLLYKVGSIECQVNNTGKWTPIWANEAERQEAMQSSGWPWWIILLVAAGSILIVSAMIALFVYNRMGREPDSRRAPSGFSKAGNSGVRHRPSPMINSFSVSKTYGLMSSKVPSVRSDIKRPSVIKRLDFPSENSIKKVVNRPTRRELEAGRFPRGKS